MKKLIFVFLLFMGCTRVSSIENMPLGATEEQAVKLAGLPDGDINFGNPIQNIFVYEIGKWELFKPEVKYQLVFEHDSLKSIIRNGEKIR